MHDRGRRLEVWRGPDDGPPPGREPEAGDPNPLPLLAERLGVTDPEHWLDLCA